MDALPISAVATDRTLAERHLWGDVSAFEEIYRAHEEMVYNLALRLAGDPERAADLTQGTFLRVYRHLDKFAGRSSLKTWIYRVAVNHCRSRLARRPPPQPVADERLETVPDPARGPEELAMAGDESRRLQSALGRLPGVYREAVVLRDLEDLTYEEIAQALGVRIGTVRSRIARGRRQLHDLLEEGPR